MSGDNGYAPSIIPGHDPLHCYLCDGNGRGKMDRHEIYHGVAWREKSKHLGLWVHLCHDECHINGVHRYAQLDRGMKAEAQLAAMKHYGWSVEDFIREFGRSYI